jgi:exonuclease SbcC
VRPLRLEVEGFACYRARQPPLDLSGLSLFAIAGPTGSGKSTILDAMLYALYGNVPRMGRQGVAELVSHGRDVLTVAFDFRLQGRDYRVVRTLKKGRRAASTAVLAELTARGEKSLADGVSDVDTRLRDLVGLDFGAFTQTVILPQNEFARFLQSRPKEQRAILQYLLRHSVYERMRAEAARRKDALERDLRIRTEQLEPLREATPDALLARGAACAEARTAREAARRERDEAAAGAQQVRIRRQRTLELEACRAVATGLDVRAPRVAALERELLAARHAAAVHPAVEALARARQRREACREDVDRARAGLRALQAALTAATHQQQAADVAAAQVERLRRFVQQLDEIRNDVERLPAVERALTLARKAVAPAATATAAARTSAASHRSQHELALEVLKAAREAAAAVTYDAARHAHLDAHRDAATRARALRKDIEDLERREQAATRQSHAASATVEACGRAEEIARARGLEARAARTAAEQARREASHRHAAGELRARLVPGEPCPVCAQVVETLPPGGDVPELAALDAAFARAVDAERAADEAWEMAGRDVAVARADAGRCVSALSGLQADLEAKRGELEGLAAGLRELWDAVAPDAPHTPVGPLLVTFEAELEALTRASAMFRERQEALAHAERTESAAALARTQAEAGLREAEQVEVQQQREQTRLTEDANAIRARIAAVTPAADPAAARTEALSAIATFERDVTMAREHAAQASRDRAAAEARLESLEGACTAAERDLDERQAEVERAISARGFTTVAAAVAAARAPDRMEALEHETREFRTQQASAAARLAELRRQIEGREVDAATLDAAERRAAAADAAHQAAVAAESALSVEVEALRRDVDRAARLRAEAETLRARLGVSSEMAMDLRSDGFQDYLLEEAFHGLVAGASSRLQQMSRRYTMEWQDGEFHVVDHDNAAERRRAETLSGGETFMASLCLALQLSDEVLQASGALRMDSLFIDEGFGTLDVQSLSEVADALETLRHDGARAIGVISHRPELTERLPGCIRVEKGVGESSWVVERVG